MDADRFDVMVVGTGFGGSATAARLAEGGMRVLMFERGPWWGPAGEQLARDRGVRRSWPRGVVGSRKFVRNVRVARGRVARELSVNHDGLFEVHRFERLVTVAGSGVGGGSLVYTNIQAEPGPDFFDAFPAELDAAELAPHYQRVRAMLRPAPVPQRPAKNRAFERAVDEAGGARPTYPDLAIAWGKDPAHPQRVVNAAGVTQTTCIHCGECVLGCPTLAKTTMDLTYVAAALQAGAQLRALAEVVAVGELPAARGGGYELRYIDHRDGEGRQHRAVADKLVLAAGTLNTLRLLFAARDRHRSLTRLPMTLGHGFSPNADLGALFVAARAHLHDSGAGPSSNAYLRVPEHGDGPLRYLVGEAGLPLSALPLPKIVQRLLGTSGLLLAMGADASTGALGFDGEFLRTEVGRDLDPEIFEAIESEAARISAAYRPRLAWINAPSGRGKRGIASVHPLGGAGIGSHPGDGVVDHRGEVFGHPGLFVADGSLYPRAPGIPPSMTIAALAERQAALMLGG
ncbi:GMC oxidoreductase [Enhygromyxa salina]|uniref:GMC oxidoreductase n=1 Tax=Enhygromyxa salina TaxID=215803 RepID=UPI0011B23CD3|nr:GMC oxidoreductase [Enhygromyxa salina]